MRFSFLLLLSAQSAHLFAVATDMTYLEGTRQIKRSGLGRHGPEGTKAHGGGRSRPAGGGAGQTAREHGGKMNADGDEG